MGSRVLVAQGSRGAPPFVLESVLGSSVWGSFQVAPHGPSNLGRVFFYVWLVLPFCFLADGTIQFPDSLMLPFYYYLFLVFI